MVDNVEANAGSGGASFATDDIAGVHFPRTKIALGADGVHDGDVSSANPLPVTGTVELGAAALAALEIITVASVTAPLAAGDNNIGNVDVATLPALPAGTNNIGDVDVLTLPALPAGTNNIGDVDVLSLPALPAGANNIGDVDVLSVIPGTGATNLGKAEDAAHTTGDVGLLILGVRNDAGTVGAGTDGDYIYFSMTSGGALRVSPGNVPCIGTIAHDAADANQPVKVGGRARTTDITAVASDDRTDAIFDTLGKQITLVGAAHDQHVRGTATYTNTTAADVIAAAGAGRRIVVTSILVVNGHATVGTKVEIRDGTTVKLQGYAAALGGGFMLNAGGAPLIISTANTAITARNVTTGADVDVTISGYTIGN